MITQPNSNLEEYDKMIQLLVRQEIEMNPNSKFSKLVLAKFALGETTEKESISWACDLLEQGFDTPHLRILAGYTEPEARRDLEDFRSDFQKTVEELGLEFPPKPEAYTDFACYICRSYLDGILDYSTSHTTLYNIWRDTAYDSKNGIDKRFEVWMYLSESIELIYDGYGPLLEKFNGLNEKNHEEYFRKEAEEFLSQYSETKDEAEQVGSHNSGGCAPSA